MYKRKKENRRLLIENGNENHYVWIKDFNKLMNSQSKNGHRLFLCYYCLQQFTSEEILKNHAEGCLKINGAQKVKLPCKNKNIFFMNYHKQLMAPFVIWGARWLSGRVSDSGARSPGFETYRRRVVSLSKTLHSPKVLVNYPGSDGSVPT